MSRILFSIVVLTHNRCEILADLLTELRQLKQYTTEIIVVDNGSCDGTAALVKENFPDFKLFETGRNLGAVGRNVGIKAARGKYVITLDDDILGLNDEGLSCLKSFYEKDLKIGAVCFQVRDHYHGGVCNWCHPQKVEEGSLRALQTTEISEGAVAFRNDMLHQTGLYPSEFFISHEGADLAARILDLGFSMYYLPGVKVTHKYALESRPDWRRYYFDTRNDFWLVVRNYRFPYLLTHLGRRIPITFFYALRDGYFLYWCRAIRDALFEMPQMLHQRKPISRETHRRMKMINKNRPGFFYLFKQRIFSRDVRI